jgi:MFS transporter, SP family, general alpha glucoside:H+ symporter
MNFTLGKHGINMVGVFGAWFLMSLGVGRRSLYLYGLCGLCSMLLILGFLGLPSDREAASMATGCIMLVWALFYQLTVGTVCYSAFLVVPLLNPHILTFIGLVAEISTRRLQIKTVAFGRVCYAIVAIITNVLTPRMLNPTAWDWGNYAGFFWAGSCFLSIIYTFFRVPEPRGRTFAELDLLFEKGVRARKFKTTKVDVFEEDVRGGVVGVVEKKLGGEERVGGSHPV